MPFNGSGVYTAPAADFPVVTQTVISSTHFNNTINDIATALSTCLTKDGQQVATANIPFGGFRATNVGITAIAGSVGTPAINVSDVGTGLYRSAASELAVTVAGAQVARFASTGLIVTGAASVSTTLTATTSVVTPLVQSAAATSFNFGRDGGIDWQVSTGTGHLIPAGDNNRNFGGIGNRLANIFVTTIDSGASSPLFLGVNNGRVSLEITDPGVATVNWLQAFGGGTGSQSVILRAKGGDTNVGFYLDARGTESVYIRSNGGSSTQFSVLHTASATRNITVTGSNGGNPTISTTAGSLAITPAVVIAGASVSVGTTPASAGDLRVPNNGSLQCRNGTNSGDIALVAGQTVNTVGDVVVVGSGSSGILGIARSAAGVPTTSDIANGRWALWRDTSGATTKLYYNNSGALQSVALA